MGNFFIIWVTWLTTDYKQLFCSTWQSPCTKGQYLILFVDTHQSCHSYKAEHLLVQCRSKTCCSKYNIWSVIIHWTIQHHVRIKAPPWTDIYTQYNNPPLSNTSKKGTKHTKGPSSHRHSVFTAKRYTEIWLKIIWRVDTQYTKSLH